LLVLRALHLLHPTLWVVDDGLAELALLLREHLLAGDLVQHQERVIELVLVRELLRLAQQLLQLDVALEDLLECLDDLVYQHRLLHDDRGVGLGHLRARLLELLHAMGVGAVVLVLAMPIFEKFAELRFEVALERASGLLVGCLRGLAGAPTVHAHLLLPVGELAVVTQVAVATQEVAAEHRFVLAALVIALLLDETRLADRKLILLGEAFH